MENNIFICIDGPPTALQRHRSFRLGSGIKSYDPQSDLKKSTLKRVLFQIPKSFQPFNIPVELIIEFHMPIPKSWSKVRKRREVDRYHDKKPDLSNMIKFIEDTFNGILYRDDSLIARIHATKTSSLDPKTIICVRECISECSKIQEVEEEIKIRKNLLFN